MGLLFKIDMADHPRKSYHEFITSFFIFSTSGMTKWDYLIYYLMLPHYHVRWDPCPHSMARPRVADGGTASRYVG
jgi:hypothetical protein